MKRFRAVDQGSQFRSEYDFPTDLLIDLNQRDIGPLFVQTLNLATAGTLQLLNTAGRALVPYFWNTGTANKTRAPAGFITTYINQQDSQNPQFALTMKHNRGYRGSFAQLYISWTAQPGVSVDLVILRSKMTPWMTDSFTNSGGGGNPSFTANTNAINFASSPYTGQLTDNFVSADATGGNIVVTTPTATNGQIFGVTKKDATANTVTISGMNGGGSIVLHNQNDSVTFWSDGSTWYPFA